MPVLLNPYLNFPDGQAREAMEFYASVLGGEPSIMTFGDMGTEGPLAQQVMHGQLETPDGLTLMGADAPPEFVQVTFGDNVSVSISGDDAEKMRRWFDALSEGAQPSPRRSTSSPGATSSGPSRTATASAGCSTSPATPRPDACPTSSPGGPTPRPRASTRAPSAPTGCASGPAEGNGPHTCGGCGP